MSAFLTLGYFMGDRWEAVEKEIHHYLLAVTIGVAMVLTAYLVWRWRRQV